MPQAHPRPWHGRSLFGDGPRRPLDREQRARFKFLLNAHCRTGHITDKGHKVGAALLARLSIDGRCDPSHETLAGDVRASTGKCSARTVRRALEAMKQLGLVLWQRRIVRAGWRVSQTSNAYLLAPVATANPPENRRAACGGQSVRQILKVDLATMPAPSAKELLAAQRALAERRRAVEQSLLTRGSAP